MDVVNAVDIVEKIKQAYNHLNREIGWKEMFVSNGEFLAGYEQNKQNKIENDLQIVFSESEMKKLACEMKKESGYEIIGVIRKKIYVMFEAIECEISLSLQYTNHFIEAITESIKKIDIDLYEKIMIGNQMEVNNQSHAEMINLMYHIRDKVCISSNEETALYETIEIINKRLRESTYPSIDLDFFDYEDEEFKDKLLQQINEECIYIVGRSREETFYCVLEQLRLIEEIHNKDIYVINTIDAWEQLREKMKDAILIPNFYVGNIAPIINNTNIFIFSESEHCNKNNKIILRHRLRNNLSRKLESVGMPYEEVNSIINGTHGVFATLKRRLFKGRYESYPLWYRNKNEILKYALLIGAWNDIDRQAIENITGYNYDDFMRILQPYFQGEDPFIVTINEGFSDKSYQLANPEEAWEFINEDLSETCWNEFCEKMVLIMSDMDDVFLLPENERIVASLINKNRYSQCIKSAMIRSLIFRRNLLNGTIQYQIDTLIEKILENINGVNSWCYISEYIVLLCEAAPSIVMKKFGKEINGNTGMLDVMAIKNADVLFTKNYYTYFLWAAETLLFAENTVIKSVRWLLALNDMNIKYSLANSPKDSLKKVFCAWHHECKLTLEQIMQVAKVAVSCYANGWDIICDELPNFRPQHIIGGLRKPHYLAYEENTYLTTVQETNRLYEYYISLCVEYAGNDVERWCKLIEDCSFFYFQLEDYSFDLLNKALESMRDLEKCKIKDKLRVFLYQHRHFADAQWSFSEEALKKIEAVYNGIRYNDISYDYAYMFGTSMSQFPLLYPVKYESEKYDFRKEEEKSRAFILQQMETFRDNNYNLADLIQKVDASKNYNLGGVIATVYCDNKYDERIIKLLLGFADKPNIIQNYAVEVYRSYGKDECNRIIEYVKEQNAPDNILALLAEIEPYDAINNPVIDTLSEDAQYIYWNRFRMCISENKPTHIKVIDKALEYKNGDAFFDHLGRGIEDFSAEECILYLEKFINTSDMKILYSWTEHHLNIIFEKIYLIYINNYDEYPRIAHIELFFRDIIPWYKLKCFVYLLKTKPNYYAELLSIVERRYDKTDADEDKYKLKRGIYSFYYELKFCPCVDDCNNIEYEQLKNWVNEYKILLEKQEQECEFAGSLGKLFAYSPIGKDGYMPHEAVRQIIDEINDDDLNNSYRIAIHNKRGVYTPDAGRSEKNMAERYKENANSIRAMYPITAEIYDRLCEDYSYEAVGARRRAEDGL